MIYPILLLMENEALKTAFLELVNRSIAASWLVLVVLVVRLLLKKAPKWVNVLLWGIVAVRLLCPFTIESALSLIPSTQTIPMNIEMAASPAIDSGVSAVNRVVNPMITVSFTPHPGASANPLQIWIPLAAVIWLLGMAAMLLYTFISYWRINRRIGTAIRYRENIFQSENVSAPFVLGIFKPKIYLPFHMGEQELSYVVAHESSHIRRKDHWWKPLGFLLLTVHWFNPLLWLAYGLLCRDIELACDERVIRELDREERADYTQALLMCSVNRRSIAACPLAFGEVGVKVRVKSVMNYKKPTFWIVILAVIVCTIIAICFLTNPKSSTVYDIFKQDGYVIIDQEEMGVTLYIEKAKLPDSIYTADGHEFEHNEVIVYSTETTKIYLHKAMISNERDDLLYFIFDFSYDIPKAGSILSPYKCTVDHYDIQSNLYLRSKDLKDTSTVYPNALNIRGHGPGTQFAFYVSKDVCQTAAEHMMIDIVCNKIIYAKEGHGYETQYDSSPEVRKWFEYMEDPSQMSYEKELKIQLEEYPDITFRYNPYEIIATRGSDNSDREGQTILISGMPIWNAYFTDLTGDGLPDICATCTLGSGIIDSRIVVCDYANGANYELSDRGNFDFVLRFDETDGYLYVEKTKYHTDEIIETGRLVFQNGCLQVEGFSSNSDAPTGQWDRLPMVMVNGTLYLDTGFESDAIERTDHFDGEITSKVDGSKEPTVNDQSNFGTGYGYQYGKKEGTIELLINGRWWIFATEEVRQALQFPPAEEPSGFYLTVGSEGVKCILRIDDWEITNIE